MGCPRRSRGAGAVLSLGRLDACANLYVGLAEAQPYERAFFEIKGVLPQAHSIGRSRNRCLPPSLLMLRDEIPPRAPLDPDWQIWAACAEAEVEGEPPRVSWRLGFLSPGPGDRSCLTVIRGLCFGVLTVCRVLGAEVVSPRAFAETHANPGPCTVARMFKEHRHSGCVAASERSLLFPMGAV